MVVEDVVSGWDDALLGEVLQLLSSCEESPISFIQRKLRIGYTRATRLYKAARHSAIESALKDSWKSTVYLYEMGLVNNESTLHAILFCEIRSRLDSYTLICEPSLLGYGKPDIVILQGSEVVAMIEVKLEKHPVFLGDIEKMRRLLSAPSPFSIKFDAAQTGRWPNLKCSICPYCLAAFVVIGRDDAVAVYDNEVLTKVGAKLPRNFLLVTHIASRVGKD